MSSRYEARTETLPNGDTKVTVIDWEGNNSRVEIHSQKMVDDFGQMISDFFDAGVQRFGSVDEFARYLAAYNEYREAARLAA